MPWFDWILRLLVSSPSTRTVRWPGLSVQTLEERAVPAVNGIETIDPAEVAVIQTAVTPRAPYPQIGDRVWLDRNGNGFQDSGEKGVGFVQMQLYQGDLLVGSTLSDPNGRYAFNRWNVHNGTLDPDDDGLKADTTYQIRIANNQPALASLMPTLANQGSGYDDEQRDSDAVPVEDGLVITITTGPEEIYTHLDVGYAQAWSISDVVWNDANNNGKRDKNEMGIGGVTVRLLDATGMHEIATTTTDPNGNYTFMSLMPGTYIVEIAESNFASGGTLPGYASSTGKPGLPPVEASGDPDDPTNSNGIRSQAVTLGGAEPAKPKVDFAIFQATEVSGRVYVDQNGNGIIDSEDSIGLANIRIRVTGPAGSFVTKTDANGNYSFGALPAATYTITRRDQPKGYRASTSAWETKTLEAGTSQTVNFGQAAIVDLRLRQSANRASVGVGGTIVLKYRIKNLGTRDATGVVLSVPLPSSFAYVRTESRGAIFDSTSNSIALDTVAAGTETIVLIRVRAVRSGSFGFRATVEGAEPEEKLGNNSAKSTLTGGVSITPSARGSILSMLFSSGH